MMFNLEDDTYKLYEVEGNVGSTSLGADYTILATRTSSTGIRTALACAPGSEEFVPLEEYLRPKYREVASWMEENMKHDLPAWDAEKEEEVVLPDVMCSGVPRSNSDMSLIVCTSEDLWAYEAYCYAYVLPLIEGAGIGDVADSAASLQLKASKGGVVTVSSDVALLTVTDLNGRVVFSVNPVSETVSTGLPSGMYVVKASAADGSSAVVKAVF